MSTLFTPMTEAERSEFLARYLDHLRRRDGHPDLATQRFSIREAFFQELDQTPVAWVGTPPVDQAVFDRNESRAYPEPGLDEATLWALAMAKVNRGERFGVELTLRTRGTDQDVRDPMVYIQIEEFYHTRVLKDALRTIGLNMEMRPPRPWSRALIRSMVHLPKRLSNVLVMCGEIGGVTTFQLLRDKARELFAQQPEALDRLETLFSQIIVDEVGHVHYLRSQIGNFGLNTGRRMLEYVVSGILDDMPELALLFGRERIMAEVLKYDVDGPAAEYPDRFQPFAHAA